MKLLNAHEVKYLLVGGYAVGYYGYVRATADMDIWIESTTENAGRMLKVVKAFGFDVPVRVLDVRNFPYLLAPFQRKSLSNATQYFRPRR